MEVASGPLVVRRRGGARARRPPALDVLKRELQARGLKCGGTLAQRAERLFLLRDASLEALDAKHKAPKRARCRGRSSARRTARRRGIRGCGCLRSSNYALFATRRSRPIAAFSPTPCSPVCTAPPRRRAFGRARAPARSRRSLSVGRRARSAADVPSVQPPRRARLPRERNSTNPNAREGSTFTRSTGGPNSASSGNSLAKASSKSVPNTTSTPGARFPTYISLCFFEDVASSGDDAGGRFGPLTRAHGPSSGLELLALKLAHRRGEPVVA